MILVLHIVIALFTVLMSLLSVARPKQARLAAAKYSTGATLLSGILLATTSDVSLGHLCTSGILVIGFCGICIQQASKKLALAKNQLR